MSWNYRISATAGDDIAAAIMAKHTAHIARYPGVSQEHAIAATPAVAEGASRAGKEAAKVKAGTAISVFVQGPDHYDPSDEGHGRKPGKVAGPDGVQRPEQPVKFEVRVTKAA